MDYANFAIVFWIVATIVIAIVGRKSLLKVFGLPNKYVKADWRGYLVTAMILGAAVSFGVTFLIKSFS